MPRVDVTQWELYRNYAKKALDKGDLAQAELHWLAAMEEAKDFDPKDTRYGVTFQGLAEVLCAEKKYNDAEPLLRHILQVCPNFEYKGSLMHCLAVVLDGQGRRLEAENAYKAGMEMLTKTKPPGDRELIRLLEEYASLLTRTHRQAEADHLISCIQGMKTGNWTQSSPELGFVGSVGSVVLPQETMGTPTTDAALAAEKHAEKGNGKESERAQKSERTSSLPTPSLTKRPPTIGLGKLRAEKQQAARNDAEPVANDQPEALRRREQSIPTAEGLPAGKAVDATTGVDGEASQQSEPPAKGEEPEGIEPPKRVTAMRRVREGLPNSAWTAYRKFALDAQVQGIHEVAENLWVSAMKEAGTFHESDPRYLVTLDGLGEVCTLINKFDDAARHLTRSLALKERYLDPDDLSLAVTLNSLAKLYYFKGQLKESLPLAMKCLELYELVYGENHPAVATTAYNIGILYHRQSDYDLAEQMYRKCWNVRRTVLGDNHPDTVKIMKNLTTLVLNRRSARAEALLDRRVNVGSISGTWKALNIDESEQLL